MERRRPRQQNPNGESRWFVGLQNWLVSKGIANTKENAKNLLTYASIVIIVVSLTLLYFGMAEEPIDEKYYFDPAVDNAENS